MSGIEETKQALIGCCEVAKLVVERISDGVQFRDVTEIISTISTNRDFQEKISNAVKGVSNIPEEVVDIDLHEATELSKVMLDYLPEFVGAFNYALRKRDSLPEPDLCIED